MWYIHNTYIYYRDGMVIYIWWKSWWWLLPVSVLLAGIVLSQPGICRDGQRGLPPVPLRDSQGSWLFYCHSQLSMTGLEQHLEGRICSLLWHLTPKRHILRLFKALFYVSCRSDRHQQNISVGSWNHKSCFLLFVMSCCPPVRYSQRIS